MGTDADYLAALEIVERDVYGRCPRALADDALPELTGAARRLVAVTLAWWGGELETRSAWLQQQIGPATRAYLAGLPVEEREAAVRGLFRRFVVEQAGPIETWASLARAFGSLLDADQSAARAALETLAPGLAARLAGRLRGAAHEAEGDEAAAAGLAGLAAVVGEGVEAGNPWVPDVAAEIARRLERAAVAAALPPGWTRARDGLDVPLADDHAAAAAPEDPEGTILRLLDAEREVAGLERHLRGAGLTEAELALALCLARGEAESLAGAARLLGRAESTARNQARAIRAKLGPRRIQPAS